MSSHFLLVLQLFVLLFICIFLLSYAKMGMCISELQLMLLRVSTETTVFHYCT